ncbi:MAG: hypothetical protein O2782_15605 [bacterium]|nr:hypothetical protein [bacterium]
MRTLLLQIHLYAGLLCSSYFVIFGLSSLNYNHHFGHAIDGNPTQWQEQLRMPAIAKDRHRALAVRDSLGLAGWAPCPATF